MCKRLRMAGQTSKEISLCCAVDSVQTGYRISNLPWFLQKSPGPVFTTKDGRDSNGLEVPTPDLPGSVSLRLLAEPRGGAPVSDRWSLVSECHRSQCWPTRGESRPATS